MDTGKSGAGEFRNFARYLALLARALTRTRVRSAYVCEEAETAGVPAKLLQNGPKPRHRPRRLYLNRRL